MARHERLGAVVTSIGLGLVTASVLTPPATAGVGADPCPAGTTLVAKFEVVGGGYVFEKPAGNEDLVTILEGADLDGGAWESTVDIVAVVVKGGSGDESVDVDEFAEPLREGTFDNLELVNPGGNVPDISFVAFCGPGQTTTSGAEETTTTVEETTTTAEETTTTAATVLPTSVVQSTTTAAAAAVTTSTTLGTEVAGVQLARTGVDVGLLRAGLVLVGAGAVWVLLGRRARTASS